MYYNKIENTYYLDSEDAILVLGKSVYNKMVKSGDLVKKNLDEVSVQNTQKEAKIKTVKSLFTPDKIRTSNKRVMCVETGEVFDSIKEASVKYVINIANICACCRGRVKSANGYHWRYA